MTVKNATLSIVMDRTKTHTLKGLIRTVPFAVVRPHTLFVSQGKIHGLAMYACQKQAAFEMTIEEFEQLDFEFDDN